MTKNAKEQILFADWSYGVLACAVEVLSNPQNDVGFGAQNKQEALS